MPKIKKITTNKEKLKSKTATVKGTITLTQKEIIRNFIGILGSNEQDVVGKILTLWLYNEGHLKNTNEGQKNGNKKSS